ncbi:MAG: hypothetical protein A2W27_04320 [Deltaproteobacteria bacterium RBG_16_44_11]|nr:MAG: hypothetical protein A2W27_04320 [Deltaproteobacteria bacterium RBG_16_44_11]
MLYRIQKSDIDKAAQILGRSFIDYPIFKYVFPDDQHRKNKIRYLFTFLIKLGMLNGEVYASSKDIEAVSIWINSSNARSPLMSAFKAGIISLNLKVDSKSVKRFSEIGLNKQKIRSDIVNVNYILLDVIGVDPQFQKQGFARLLMESKLNDADKYKTPCYLETSNRDNLNFYKKFGFNLIHEYELLKIKVFCLYRKSF